MKKTFAAVTVALMLAGSTMAFAANPSPEATEVTEPPKGDNVSPKTADFNIVFVEGLGVVLLGAAGATYALSRKRS